MQYLSLVLVSLLFLSFATYVFLGTYIIKLNPKGLINRLFLGACIAMSIWSMGLAMSMSSQTLEAGLFWQRFSAIGRTSVYAIILHFIIVLTKKNSNKLWFLYIPAFINLYLFSFSNRITGLQYQLIRTDIGLLNRPPHNGYNLFFYLYYISFMLITFIFSWKWTKGLESKKAIKQGKIILLSGIAAFVLGSVTDVFSGLVFKTPLPQLAPVFILLPTWSIYILARYFGFIGLKEQVKDELILTEDEQEKIFKNLSIAYLLGGIVSFLAKYNRFADNGKGDLISALQKGGSILLIGAFVYAAQGIKSKKTKENLTIGLLLFSIPLISLQFLERTSITIWALPIIIIMSSLIFSKKTMLISTTIVAIITQGVIWELKPESLVYVDQYNFIGRIGMFVIAFLVGSYINRIYTSKIKENTYKIKFQKMNSEVSLDFIALSKENFDEKMDSLLFKIGDFFGVERTYLFTVNHEKGTISYSNEWCAEGVEPENHGSGDFSVEEISWLLDQLKKNKSVYMEDVENEGKSHFSKAKTFVLVPVIGEGDIQGFIGMDSMRIKMKWSMEDINLLEIMASTVARGLLQIKADEEIEFMAYYDHLTRLPNRFLFQDRVNQRIEAAKKVASPISVVFLNLDNFKLINNTLGHNSGDALLKEIARALQGKLGKRDFVARFTGDEFLIMLTNLNVIDQVMAVFQEPFEINGQNVFVTASAGVGTYLVDGEDAESLIKNANIAMYKAKEIGKSQYKICTQEMKLEVEKSIMLSNDLYKALEKDELVVYYQPQIELESGKIAGLEALVRWDHPKWGMIPPGVFIPLAEKNNLINSIGEWVLRTAVAQNKKWQDMGFEKVRVGVNLSAIQFIDPKLADHVEGILKEIGLDPKYLELEITESIAIKVASDVVPILDKLKAIGISIAIDDFGTEYSSLSRLKVLPIDRIKIDMQFIRGIETGKKDKAITKVIINLGKSLGLNVLAEGVETEPQLDFLNKKMCDYVQGFYYYKPLPGDEIEKILANRQ